jgi:hypothetical protein
MHLTLFFNNYNQTIDISTRTSTRLFLIIKCHRGYSDKIRLLNSEATEVWKAGGTYCICVVNLCTVVLMEMLTHSLPKSTIVDLIIHA